MSLKSLHNFYPKPLGDKLLSIMKKQAILINKITKKYDKNPSFVKRGAIKKYDRVY